MGPPKGQKRPVWLGERGGAGDEEGGKSQITMGFQNHLKDRDLTVRTDETWMLLKREEEGGRAVGAPALCVEWMIARFMCQNPGVGCHFLLQGTSPTRGLNTSLLCPALA